MICHAGGLITPCAYIVSPTFVLLKDSTYSCVVTRLSYSLMGLLVVSCHHDLHMAHDQQFCTSLSLQTQACMVWHQQPSQKCYIWGIFQYMHMPMIMWHTTHDPPCRAALSTCSMPHPQVLGAYLRVFVLARGLWSSQTHHSWTTTKLNSHTTWNIWDTWCGHNAWQ